MSADDIAPVRLVLTDRMAEPKNGRVAITTFGLSWSDAEPLLAPVQKRVLKQKRVPLFILTHVAPRWLADPENLAEYLPPRAGLPALDGREWAQWASRRWEILRAKWDIRSEITLGQSFDLFLEREKNLDQASSG